MCVVIGVTDIHQRWVVTSYHSLGAVRSVSLFESVDVMGYPRVRVA